MNTKYCYLVKKPIDKIQSQIKNEVLYTHCLLGICFKMEYHHLSHHFLALVVGL